MEATPTVLLAEIQSIQKKLMELSDCVRTWGFLELPPPVFKVKIETIIQAACDYYQIPTAFIMLRGSGSRRRSRARQVAMMAIYDLLGLSYREIIAIFNRKGCYSLKRVRHHVAEFREELEIVKQEAKRRMDLELNQFHPRNIKEEEPDFSDANK